MAASLVYGLPFKTFDALALANTTGGTAFAVPIKPGAQGFIWQTSYGTVPSAISICLQVSVDGTNWTTIDTSTTTAGEVRTILNKLGLYVRGYMTSYTGGTVGTLTLVYI